MNLVFIICLAHLPVLMIAEPFKAAVYEPTVSSRSLMLFISRTKAIKEMKTILNEYEDIAKRAHQEGVDILVFPENGLITNYKAYSRSGIEKFLDTIPEPNKDNPWIPCDNPNQHPRTEIQEVISCIAKRNKIYLLVNLGDKQPCNNTADPNCPSDGYYQYNTNVVYSSEGALVSRYHKKHLFYEPYYNSPKTAEYSVFETPFGRFASIVCFDIFYNDTLINLVENYNVSNILFPNLWFDYTPFFLSVLFHNSIAKALNINLISANSKINGLFSIENHGGSGIFTPHHDEYIYKPFTSTPSDGYISSIVQDTQANTSFPWPPMRPVPTSDNSDVKETTMSQYFPVSAVILKKDSGVVSVCKFGACCSLEYQFIANRTSPFDVNYILAINNKENVDLDNPEGDYTQSCVLCPVHKEKISCLMILPKNVPESYLSFSKLKMTAHNFSTNYLFPHITTFNSVSSYDINKSWWHDKGQIGNTKTIEKLFTAVILGRQFPRTTSSSSTFTLFSGSFFLFIFLNLISKELLG
ncbi:vascular non-inflammatory molecule 3-like [Argonauta hians]